MKLPSSKVMTFSMLWTSWRTFLKELNSGQVMDSFTIISTFTTFQMPVKRYYLDFRQILGSDDPHFDEELLKLWGEWVVSLGAKGRSNQQQCGCFDRLETGEKTASLLRYLNNSTRDDQRVNEIILLCILAGDDLRVASQQGSIKTVDFGHDQGDDRRMNLESVWHAAFTFHWSLNHKKLPEVGLARLGTRETISRAIDHYELPNAPITIGFRKMKRGDLI
ncbi:hypothetical protein V2J09_012598 [Rumex salicifolius]